MQAILVVTTVGTEDEANSLAQELVERHLSCCVNILPIHRSIYRWQGKICTDSEFMLIIKAVEGSYARIEATIKELHSYELPEILAFDIKQGEKGFLQWIYLCCGSEGQAASAGEQPEASD